MAFTRRRDGTYLKGLPPFKRIFPYVMKTRNESVVYFSQKIDMTAALAYLDSANQGKEREERLSFFHIFLTAIARTLKLRPELNRFVAGRRIYEHNDITVAFIVKKEFTEEAPETNAQLTFRGDESLLETREKLERYLQVARSDAKAAEDDLVATVGGLPRPISNFIAWTIHTLDYHNLLPEFLMKAIPLYASVYLTNVGSIGLDAPFHHLYEFGSASLFMGIGKLHKEAFVDEEGRIVARDCINLTFTLDDRITEGFYCARSILLFQKLVEDPMLLENGAITTEEILKQGA